MDQQLIYDQYPEQYDELVRAEDVDGNLIRAIRSIRDLQHTQVLEVGAGTGRITRQLVEKGARVVATDRAAAMLRVAEATLTRLDRPSAWELHVADAARLPVADQWADLAVAGWVFGHFRLWMPDRWMTEVASALSEMRRALKPSGAALIVETLGTGQETPAPPSPALAEYYQWLEKEQGMHTMWIRTDYVFPDPPTAARIMGFFFGETFKKKVLENQWTRIPECTGIWWSVQEP